MILLVILAALTSLSSCHEPRADCWRDLLQGHVDFRYSFDRSDVDLEEMTLARSRLKSQLAACSSDAAFFQVVNPGRVEDESYVSLLDMAIISDDAELTAKYAAEVTQQEFEVLNGDLLEYGGRYVELGSYFESVHAVVALLDAGYDPNGVDEQGGVTPLHAAKVVSENGLQLIRELVRFGGDLDAATESGITPIVAGRQNGDLAKVQCLYVLGARVPEASVVEGLSNEMPRVLGASRESIAAIDSFLSRPQGQVPKEVANICELK